MPAGVLRAAIVLGALIDGGVGVLALFFQNLLDPLIGVPVKDPGLTTFLGGELVVVAFVYIALFRNLEKYRGLLLIVALDQFFAVLLPGIEIARGHLAASWKTVGPLPLSALLSIVYAIGSRRPRPRLTRTG